MVEKYVNITIIALTFILAIGAVSGIVSLIPDANNGTRFEMLFPATTLDNVDVTVRLLGFKDGENADKFLAAFVQSTQMRVSWFKHADIEETKLRKLMPELLLMLSEDGVKIDSIYQYIPEDE